MERPNPRKEIDRLNEAAANETQRLAELMCQKVIGVIYEGISIHLGFDKDLKEDLMLAGYPEGETVEYYVMTDELTAPRKDKEFVETYSTMIESPNGKSYMKIHIPVGDANTDELEMPAIEAVSEAYIELHDGDTHWYAIGQTGLYEYIPLANQTKDTADILNEEGIWRWINNRVPETLSVIARIDERLINWETVHQSGYVIKDN